MIDGIDRKILSLLQENGRLSHTAVAEEVGLATATVYERIKKLEKKGLIKGYTALVDAGMLGKPVTAFIRLTVSGASEEGYAASKRNLVDVCRREPDVLECHSVAGEDCYVLKVRAATPQDLEKLLERLRCHAFIAKSTSSIVLSTYKETTQIQPVRESA
jgi:Lrp/AsnC family leucine-responsive transcriptional regulator